MLSLPYFVTHSPLQLANMPAQLPFLLSSSSSPHAANTLHDESFLFIRHPSRDDDPSSTFVAVGFQSSADSAGLNLKARPRNARSFAAICQSWNANGYTARFAGSS